MNLMTCLLCGCALLAGMTIPRMVQDQPPGESGSDDMAKMMEAWMKTASPGEHHGHLKPLAGAWDLAGKFRMGPAAPWTESKSRSKAEWILGGRFLTQTIVGEPMEGMPGPFEGFGVVGYDNIKGKYVSVWMDNMGTMMMVSEGTCDDEGQTITFVSEPYQNPFTGQKTRLKSVYRIVSNDKYVLSMYEPGPDGKEYLGMELTHTRRR